MLRPRTFRHSAGCGIMRIDLSDGFETDFTAGLGNTFSDNADGDQCNSW